jgi:hypothetical protein
LSPSTGDDSGDKKVIELTAEASSSDGTTKKITL